MSHPPLEAPPEAPLEAYGSSSSSELSELEDSDLDAPLIAFGNAGGRRDTAETSVKLERSSEDVKERQRGREIEAKNTWALSDSEISDTDSLASRTSEDSSDSSATESEASDLLHGIRIEEIESDVDGAPDDESLDEISERAQDLPVRRLDSDYGKRGKIAKVKTKHVTDHGTSTEVQRSKPWEIVA